MQITSRSRGKKRALEIKFMAFFLGTLARRRKKKVMFKVLWHKWIGNKLRQQKKKLIKILFASRNKLKNLFRWFTRWLVSARSRSTGMLSSREERAGRSCIAKRSMIDNSANHIKRDNRLAIKINVLLFCLYFVIMQIYNRHRRGRGSKHAWSSLQGNVERDASRLMEEQRSQNKTRLQNCHGMNRFLITFHSLFIIALEIYHFFFRCENVFQLLCNLRGAVERFGKHL